MSLHTTGVNTHPQIDAAIAILGGGATLSHTSLSGIGTNTHAAIDTSLSAYGTSLSTHNTTIGLLTAVTAGYATSLSTHDTTIGLLTAATAGYATSLATHDTTIGLLTGVTGGYATSLSTHDTTIGLLTAATATYSTTNHTHDGAVLLDAITAVADLGGAQSLVLPNTTARALSTTAEAYWDSDNKALMVYTGTSAVVLARSVQHVDIPVYSPSVSLDAHVAHFDRNVTFLSLYAKNTTGAGYTVFRLAIDGATAIHAAVTATTTATSLSSFTSPYLTAGSDLSFLTDAVSSMDGYSTLVTVDFEET